MVNVPTEEELRKMSPDERIKRLRELADARKKELEEARKQVEEELAAAEEIIERSEDEKDEEEQAIEQAREKLRDLSFEENLEERLAQAARPQEDAGRQYQQPSTLYQALPDAISELERLYGQKAWSQEDVRNYTQAKEQLERVQQYTLSSDRLAEELDLGVNILNKLKYRT